MMQKKAFTTRWRAVAVLLLSGAASLQAQRRQPLEFTQQGVLVANFWVVGKETPSLTRDDMRFGRKVGDNLRDRLGRVVNKREALMIPAYDIRESMIAASYSPDAVLRLDELRQQGEFFRVDEIVHGYVTRLPNGGVKLDAHLVLWRDLKLRQPLPTVTNANYDRGIDELANRVSQARSQLTHQRRCENFLREGRGAQAIRAAREGISAYPRGTLARTCLVWALRATGASAQEILAESNTVLEIDPQAPHALEAAAVALDSLKRRAEAATMWLRLAATDSLNVELIERVAWSMAETGNSRAAELLIVRISDLHPDNMRLMRQRWRIANDNRNWPMAVAAGEKLMAMDAEAAGDSIFFLRLATAYRSNQQPFKAVETVSRGVTTFPKDARLYALYTQFIKEEADTVIPRGLALHPQSAELLALNARELRSRGRVEEALDASKRAVELDSTLAQGRMLVAQTEIELGRPDSALVTLKRAVAAGEDTSTVAGFALSKGNTFFRAANATKVRGDFQLAMSYLALADSLKPTPQTKFLLGASALSVAQMALTDAPANKVKAESCSLAQLGADTLPIARASLEAGVEVSPEATKEYLDYLDVISPYAEKQIAAFCVPAEAGPNGSVPANRG